MYNCFYCDETFKSEEDLATHPANCHELEPLVYFTCDICSLDFKNGNDLERHEKVKHIESEVFWCVVCPLYFNSERDLQFHIRGCHWDNI